MGQLCRTATTLSVSEPAGWSRRLPGFTLAKKTNIQSWTRKPPPSPARFICLTSLPAGPERFYLSVTNIDLVHFLFISDHTVLTTQSRCRSLPPVNAQTRTRLENVREKCLYQQKRGKFSLSLNHIQVACVWSQISTIPKRSLCWRSFTCTTQNAENYRCTRGFSGSEQVRASVCFTLHGSNF